MSNFLINSTTAECMATLVGLEPLIEEVSTVHISRPIPLQDRLHFSAHENNCFGAALDTRAKTGLPFWDCLLLDGFKRGDIPVRFLDEVKFHQSNYGKERWLSREMILQGELNSQASSFEGDEMLSILSEFRLARGQVKHLVFIDFHIPVSILNTQIVTDVAERLLPYPSLIIESGASYHVIGTKLVEETEFKRTLATALLFGPIVDRAYIAHQLIEGRAALRLSQGGHFNRVPKLLKLTGPS